MIFSYTQRRKRAVFYSSIKYGFYFYLPCNLFEQKYTVRTNQPVLCKDCVLKNDKLLRVIIEITMHRYSIGKVVFVLDMRQE